MSNMSNMLKIAVYTAVIGNIDRLWSALVRQSKADFVAFVDSHKLEVGHWSANQELRLRDSPSLPTWEQRIVEVPYGDRRTARYYKCLPHRVMPDADIWIWVDGNVRPRIAPITMVRKWLPKGSDLATFNHPDRSDIWEEVDACIRFKKDRPKVLREQLRAYSNDGHPRRWGLAETKVVIRRNTPEMVALNEEWWEEIMKYSLRDQVSLPHVCWRRGVKWSVIPGKATHSQYFEHPKHTKGRSVYR